MTPAAGAGEVAVRIGGSIVGAFLERTMGGGPGEGVRNQGRLGDTLKGFLCNEQRNGLRTRQGT